jgi:hypothetical protein
MLVVLIGGAAGFYSALFGVVGGYLAEAIARRRWSGYSEC